MLRIIAICFLIVAAYTKPVQAKTDYLTYHKLILEAEKLFLSNKFDSSIIKYKEVFARYKPFAKDCFIALQICCLRSDTLNASYFFEKSFQYGVNWAVLQTVPCISELLSNDRYNVRIKQLYEPGRRMYFASIDTSLRNVVLTMLKHDNDHRAVPGKPRRVQDSVYAEALDKNINALLKICSQYGYPGEHLIGVYDDVRIRGEFFPLRLSSLPAIMFFHHHCGRSLLKGHLLQAIEDGELQPKEYALIYEWAHATKDTKRSIAANREKCGLLTANYSAANMPYDIQCEYPEREKFYNIYIKPFHYCRDAPLVNLHRKEIGMASIQHDVAKKRFEQKHGLKLFFGLFERY